MDKLKYVKLENEDGSYSDSIPLAVDVFNIEMNNGENLQDTIGNINVDEDGNISEQLEDTKNNLKNKVSRECVEDNTQGYRFLEKMKNPHPTLQSNFYTIKDCFTDSEYTGLNIDNFQYLNLINFNILYSPYGIIKNEGWIGANRFDRLRSYGCNYPLKINGYSAGGRNYLTNSCFEIWKIGLETSGDWDLSNCYFGDNNVTLGEGEITTTFKLNEGATLRTRNCDLGSVNKKGSPIITMNGTEANPIYVECKDTNFAISGDNSNGALPAGIAQLSNKNDRCYFDNCRFKESANGVHNTKPFYLKEYKTVWSKHPIKNYLQGGKIYDLLSFCPDTLSNVAIETGDSTDLINPWGGNIISFTNYNLTLYYSIPKEKIGKQMWLITYIRKMENDHGGRFRPAVSDCEGDAENLYFSVGQSNSLMTPRRGLYSFIPTKEHGKIVLYENYLNNTKPYVHLTGCFLVDDEDKWLVGDYEDWDKDLYSSSIPKYNGFEGQIIYTLNPTTVGYLGWIYINGQWEEYQPLNISSSI